MVLLDNPSGVTPFEGFVVGFWIVGFGFRVSSFLLSLQYLLRLRANSHSGGGMCLACLFPLSSGQGTARQV